MNPEEPNWSYDDIVEVSGLEPNTDPCDTLARRPRLIATRGRSIGLLS